MWVWRSLELQSQEVNYVEMNQFAAVTDDPEFCLGTTPLYIDTRNNCIGNTSRGMQEVGKIE